MDDVNDLDERLSSEICSLEQRCRDAVLLPSIYRFLLEKEQAYAQVCALLDFIGDSEIALSSISTADGRAKIEPYFLAYGALQLMYARQVALRAVLTTLDSSIPETLKSNSIVKPRDCVIGHPVTSDGGAHVILRNTLNEDGFEYLISWPKNNHGESSGVRAITERARERNERWLIAALS